MLDDKYFDKAIELVFKFSIGPGNQTLESDTFSQGKVKAQNPLFWRMEVFIPQEEPRYCQGVNATIEQVPFQKFDIFTSDKFDAYTPLMFGSKAEPDYMLNVTISPDKNCHLNQTIRLVFEPRLFTFFAEQKVYRFSFTMFVFTLFSIVSINKQMRRLMW